MEPINNSSRVNENDNRIGGVNQESLIADIERRSEKGESVWLGALFTILFLIIGKFLGALLTDSLFFQFGIGIVLALMFGVGGFFIVDAGDAGLRFVFGAAKYKALLPGLHWEFWLIYKHKTMRVDEFDVHYTTESEESRGKKIKMLSSDNIRIGLSINVRVVVTDLRKYYLKVVSTPGDSINELIGSYLRMYVKNFPARLLPEHRREISLWIQGEAEEAKDLLTLDLKRKEKKLGRDEKGRLNKLPSGFIREFGLDSILKTWGIAFPTVVVEQIVLPDEMVQETEQLDAKETEMTGITKRAKQLMQDSGGELNFVQALQTIKEQEGFVNTVRLDGGEIGDFATGQVAGSTPATKRAQQRRAQDEE